MIVDKQGPNIEPCGTPFANGELLFSEAVLCVTALPGLMNQKEFHFQVLMNSSESAAFKMHRRPFLRGGS